MGRGGAGASVRLGFFIRERGSRRERSETLAPHAGLPEFDLWLAAHVSATAVSLDHRRRCARSLEPASWAGTAASPFGVMAQRLRSDSGQVARLASGRAAAHWPLLTRRVPRLARRCYGRVTHWRENRSEYRCA